MDLMDLGNSVKLLVAEIHGVPDGGTEYTFKTGSIHRDTVNGNVITNGELYESKSIIVGSSNYVLVADSKVIFDASGSRIQGKISETRVMSWADNFFSFSEAPTLRGTGVVEVLGHLLVIQQQ